MKAPTEIPMKQWRMEQAEREGCCENNICRKLSKGAYPNLKIRRVNKRVVFVEFVRTAVQSRNE
jgi:hypothetical protein